MKFYHPAVCCKECKAIRVNTSAGYSCCPDGHGKLQPKITNREIQDAFVNALPTAKQPGRLRRFTIPGVDGEWRPVPKTRAFRHDGEVPAGCVVAILVGKGGRLARRIPKLFERLLDKPAAKKKSKAKA